MPSQRKRIFWVAGRGRDRQTDSDREKNRQTDRNKHDMLCLPPYKKQSPYSGRGNRDREEETEKEKGQAEMPKAIASFFLYVNVHLQSAV